VVIDPTRITQIRDLDGNLLQTFGVVRERWREGVGVASDGRDPAVLVLRVWMGVEVGLVVLEVIDVGGGRGGRGVRDG
jgi:hypothetical protein